MTARRLVTNPEPGRDLAGAIVRLVPHWSATDAAVEYVEANAYANGAASVRMTPRPPGAEVVAPAAPVEALSIRKVVEGMVAEARTADREKLAALVERFLADEGL